MKLLPIADWLPTYPRINLRGDVIAGIALAGLLIPEAMGYAGIAGLPPQAGLYATAFGLIAYAIFGSSRQLAVSPTSASSAILAVTVAPLAAHTPGKFFVLASAVSLVLGLLFMLGGILKLGYISDFISKPVLKGFVFGIALTIVIKQLPKLLGIEKGSGPSYSQLWHSVTHASQSNPWAVVTAAVALVVLFIFDKYLPRIPGALVVLAGGIIASKVLGLYMHGVDIVGVIPSGLPRPEFPMLTWSDWLEAAPAAVGLALVLYVESVGAARTYATRNNYDIAPNQELRALGVANITSAIFHGMPVGGGTSGTAANNSNGAKSQVSSITASLMVMLTLLFLTRWFYHLPEAVLGAIVVHAVWHLLDITELRRVRRIRRIEFREAMAAIVGVIAFGILDGLVLAVILTLIALMRTLSNSQVAVLGRLQGTREFVDISRHPEAEQFPGIMILRIERMLFFANADGVRQHIHKLLRKATGPVQSLVISFELIPVLDVTAIDVLEQVRAAIADKQMRLVLAGVRDPVRDRLAKAGLLAKFGEANIFRSVEQAVDTLTFDSATRT